MVSNIDQRLSLYFSQLTFSIENVHILYLKEPEKIELLRVALKCSLHGLKPKVCVNKLKYTTTIDPI